MRRLAALLVVGLVLVASGCCGPCGGGRSGCGYAPANGCGCAPTANCAPRTAANCQTMCCQPNAVNACYY
jgi:hypothetical protein